MITDLKINEEKKKEYYEKGYWTRETIRDVWERQARAHAGEEYVADDQGCRMTYGEVDDAAARLGRVARGRRASSPATWSPCSFPTGPSSPSPYVACFKAGAVIQSLARNFNGADLTYAMNLVESRAYIGPTSFHGVDYEQQILDIAGDIPTLKVIALRRQEGPQALRPAHRGRDRQDHRALGREGARRIRPGGVPALHLRHHGQAQGGHAHPQQHPVLRARLRRRASSRTADDVMWMPVAPEPRRRLLPRRSSRRFCSAAAPCCMQDFRREGRHRRSSTPRAPPGPCRSTPFIYDIAERTWMPTRTNSPAPRYVLHSCGGAPVPAALIERAHNHDILLCEIFGSTESCPHVFVPPEQVRGMERRLVRHPLPRHRGASYIDEHGKDVAPGVQGEHISRGPAPCSSAT